MKRKRKFDLKGGYTFIQQAIGCDPRNAKIIAQCWNKILKYSIVHIRRGYIVSAAIKCQEDYNRMMDFRKRVNERRRQMREEQDAAIHAMFLGVNRRIEFACRYVIENPIVGDITKAAMDERKLSILKARREDGSMVWRLKQGETIIKLNFEGKTLEDFARWLKETYHERITNRGVEKESEQTITPLHPANNEKQ